MPTATPNSDTLLEIERRLATLSLEELNQIYEAWKFAYERRKRQAAKTYWPGQRVNFEDRNGRTLQGKVTKVNRKTVNVNVDGTPWRVDASLLRSLD